MHNYTFLHTQAQELIARVAEHFGEDGTDIVLDGALTPLRAGGEELTHVVAVLRDATPEIDLEEQVRPGQQLRAVGRPAGGEESPHSR